jgi:hypothetical protein
MPWCLVKLGVNFIFTLSFKAEVTFLSVAAARFNTVILGSEFVKKCIYGYKGEACILAGENTH